MPYLEIDKMSVSQLQTLFGGKVNQRGDILISPGRKWQRHEVGDRPLRAEASGMVLCVGGEMTINIDLDRHHFKKGDLLVFGPAHVLEIEEVSDDYTIDFLVFQGEFSGRARSELTNSLMRYHLLKNASYDMIRLADDEYEVIRKYMSLVYGIIERASPAVLHHLILAILMTVNEYYAGKRNRNGRNKSRQDEYLHKFLAILYRDYKEHRSIQHYAQALHLTPKYLAYVVKEASGRSAAEWISEFVIREAKIMLKFTSKSIQEITYILNFPTQSFFGKYFKRHTGISPSDYRAAVIASSKNNHNASPSGTGAVITTSRPVTG